MKNPTSSIKGAFSLIETVIAIGVLAVLLTGFMIVFAPAAAGIKKAISAEEADRLASTLEQELVTSRGGDPTPGFNKAFKFIQESDSANTALFVYQYRGSLSQTRTEDGTPEPVADASTKRPGVDYAVISMVRRKSDNLFTEDMKAAEGGVYLAKCKQLVFKNGQLEAGTAGQITDPKNPGAAVSSVNDYPEAVIAFSAEFYSLPAKRSGYFTSAFQANFSKFKNPVFTRNLAVRR